jgi:hypothetical protein
MIKTTLFCLSLAICNQAIAGQSNCLAKTIYHELRSGTTEAQVKIVSDPTLNRAADLLVGGFAAAGSKVAMKRLDICAVIHKKGQYQWTAWHLSIAEIDAWNEAKALAKEILSKKYYVVTSRRFFNNASLGKLHKTDARPLNLSGMVAY